MQSKTRAEAQQKNTTAEGRDADTSGALVFVNSDPLTFVNDQ